MKSRFQKPHHAPPFAVELCEDDDAVCLPIPGYRQARTYTCGFASALMVLRYFGRTLPAETLFEQLNTARDGTRQTAIVQTLRSAGVHANIRYDMTFDNLARQLDRGKLVVGYLSDIEHWLVVYGYGRTPRRVFVADPRPHHRCQEPWSSYGARLGRFGIVCSRDPEAQKAPRGESGDASASGAFHR